MPFASHQIARPRVKSVMSCFERCCGTPTISGSSTWTGGWSSSESIKASLDADEEFVWVLCRHEQRMSEAGWGDSPTIVGSGCSGRPEMTASMLLSPISNLPLLKRYCMLWLRLCCCGISDWICCSLSTSSSSSSIILKAYSSASPGLLALLDFPTHSNPGLKSSELELADHQANVFCVG